MDWYKILTALFLIALLVFIFPRAKHMMKHSPKGTASDWKSFLIPIVFVVLFVIFLVMSVR
jgi:hypothetical protein